jgi:hypothetical protein
MTYTPNFNDPRVQSRARRALGFVIAVMSDTKPQRWSTRYIDRHLGQQQHELSQWLRHQLLIETNTRYNKDTGVCKEYIRSQVGCDLVRTQLLSVKEKTYTHTTLVYNKSVIFEQQVVKTWCQEEFAEELRTHIWTYDDLSSRLHHPLQRVRSEIRQQVLAENGLCYDYDIECCAPTAILYHAHQCGMTEYLFAIRGYLNRRTSIRRYLADSLVVDIHTVKQIINALFCGAKVGCNPDFDISRLLQHDPARIQVLKNNHYIQQLRREIKLCWDYIENSGRYTIKFNKSNRRMRMTAKRKWAVYFDLERQLLNQVREYLTETSNNHFLIHDGWTSTKAVDVPELIARIKSRLDIPVRISLNEQHTHTTLLYNKS